MALALILTASLSVPTFATTSEISDTELAENSIDSKIETVVESKIAYAEADISVEATKTLVDFSGNEYKLVECNPSGYYIVHPESGVIVEYSTNSPSPYEGYNTGLYYCGPTYYYIKSGDAYTHTITNENLNVEDVAEAVEVSNRLNTQLIACEDENAVNFIEGNTSEFSTDTATRSLSSTDYWVTSYTWFKNLTSGFGYVSGGYCGYIAANLILKYWNYRGGISLHWVYAITNSTELTNALISIGEDLGYSANSYAWTIEDVVDEFCSQNSLPGNATWALTNIGIQTEIGTNQRPCILFGNLENAGNHAVVVYGYNLYESPGYTTYICHFGWNNYSEVHLSMAGTSVLGSNTKYSP